MAAAAAERCDEFGWNPLGRVDDSLFAETTQRERFGAGHAWSRSASYSLQGKPGRIYAVLNVEGRFDFTVDGTSVTADPGSLILLDGEAPATALTEKGVARYVWYIDPTFLRPGRSAFRFGEPISTESTSIQALTMLTNGLLNSPKPVTKTASRHLALSFENLLAGVLDESRHRQRWAAEHHDGVFMAATAAIESCFRDPAFTVASLAKEISVSTRTLHEVFQRMGSTPRREIERRRVAEAVSFLESGRMGPGELSARSGFTNARQLRRALSRDDVAVSRIRGARDDQDAASRAFSASTS